MLDDFGFTDAVGLLGALMLCGAYFGISRGWFDARRLPYHLVNLGGSSLLLTTGLISWVLRGGALASALLSTLPLWRGMDPLPLLAGRKVKKKVDKKPITDTQIMDRPDDVGHSRQVRDAEKMFADAPDAGEDPGTSGKPS